MTRRNAPARLGYAKLGSKAHARRCRPIAWTSTLSVVFRLSQMRSSPGHSLTENHTNLSVEHVSKFITESGLMEPREVEGQIRLMLKEMYP